MKLNSQIICTTHKFVVSLYHRKIKTISPTSFYYSQIFHTVLNILDVKQNFKLGDELWSNYYRKGIVVSSKTSSVGVTLIEVHFVFFVCYVTIWFYSDGTFYNEQDKIGNALKPIAEYIAPRFNGVVIM